MGNKIAKIHTTTDATVWADEFLKIYPVMKFARGTIISWFANAIETGRTAGIKDEREYSKTMNLESSLEV